MDTQGEHPVVLLVRLLVKLAITVDGIALESTHNLLDRLHSPLSQLISTVQQKGEDVDQAVTTRYELSSATIIVMAN